MDYTFGGGGDNEQANSLSAELEMGFSVEIRLVPRATVDTDASAIRVRRRSSVVVASVASVGTPFLALRMEMMSE
jgi:hypothetical protein